MTHTSMHLIYKDYTSGYLKAIGPAAQLRVYRDAAHFHARQTEEHLRASAPLKKPEELEEKANSLDTPRAISSDPSGFF